MGLGFEVFYLIRAKDSLLQLIVANPHDANFLITEPHVWSRMETTGDYSPLAHRLAYVKVLFLAWLHHDLLSLNEPPKEPFHERLQQMLGPEPFTPSVFDQWWTIERFDDKSDVEEIEHLIEPESLRKASAPGIDYVQSHLRYVLDKKVRGAEKGK